jgi:hypothetical protein
MDQSWVVGVSATTTCLVACVVLNFHVRILVPPPGASVLEHGAAHHAHSLRASIAYAALAASQRGVLHTVTQPLHGFFDGRLHCEPLLLGLGVILLVNSLLLAVASIAHGCLYSLQGGLQWRQDVHSRRLQSWSDSPLRRTRLAGSEALRLVDTARLEDLQWFR